MPSTGATLPPNHLPEANRLAARSACTGLLGTHLHGTHHPTLPRSTGQTARPTARAPGANGGRSGGRSSAPMPRPCLKPNGVLQAGQPDRPNAHRHCLACRQRRRAAGCFHGHAVHESLVIHLHGHQMGTAYTPLEQPGRSPRHRAVPVQPHELVFHRACQCHRITGSHIPVQPLVRRQQMRPVGPQRRHHTHSQGEHTRLHARPIAAGRRAPSPAQRAAAHPT